MAINNTLNIKSLTSSPGLSFQTPVKATVPAPKKSSGASASWEVKPAPKPIPAPVSNKPTSYPNVAPVKQSAPAQSQMTTPSGVAVTGNPATFAGTKQFAQPVTGLFGNVAQSLANRSYESSAPISTAVQTLQDTSTTGNDAIVRNIRDISDRYGKEYADVGRKGANAEAGYLTTGTSPVAQGAAGVIARNTAAQQAAIAQGQQMALKGVEQELAAQGQKQSGIASAGGLAGTQQGLVQSGLSSAGQLTAPQLGAIGSQQYYSPVDGSSGAGTLPPTAQSVIQNYAEQVRNGQMTRSDAESRISAYGVTGLNALNSALGSGFNTIASDARAGSFATQEQQYQAYLSAHQQSQALQAQVTDLITSFGLNSNDINEVNRGIQKIASNISDPKYQTLYNYLKDISSRYAQILTPPGGSATDTTRAVADSMIDATAKGASIISVMKALDQQAEAVIQNVRTSGANQVNNAPLTWDNL